MEAPLHVVCCRFEFEEELFQLLKFKSLITGSGWIGWLDS